MHIRRPAHVIVLGGGILGASTAAHLVRGRARVTLLTEGHAADGASGRSLSWLNSSGARSEHYNYLRLLGIDRYRTWRVQHPRSERFLRFDGGLKWAGPSDSLQDTFTQERSRGYDAVWLDRSGVSKRLPDVRAAAVPDQGAIFNPGEGWVHLPHLITELLAEARAGGATVLEGVGAVDVVSDDGAVRAIRLADGRRISADHVVLATGAAVPGQLAALGVHVPDATVPACLITTAPLGVPVRTVLNTPRVAVRPMPDGGVALDSRWAEESVVTRADGACSVPDSTVARLLDEAANVIAGNPALAVRSVGVGLKPIPGDGEPIVGAVPAVPGLSVLFTHSGATLGLILGELMAEQVLSGDPSPVLRRFRVGRFMSGDMQPSADGSSWTPVRSAR